MVGEKQRLPPKRQWRQGDGHEDHHRYCDERWRVLVPSTVDFQLTAAGSFEYIGRHDPWGSFLGLSVQDTRGGEEVPVVLHPRLDHTRPDYDGRVAS